MALTMHSHDNGKGKNSQIAGGALPMAPTLGVALHAQGRLTIDLRVFDVVRTNVARDVVRPRRSAHNRSTHRAIGGRGPSCGRVPSARARVFHVAASESWPVVTIARV